MKPSDNRSFVIWVDADSCPRAVRDIIIRCALRLSINTCFVANREIPLPQNTLFKMILCGTESDAADNYIVDNAGNNDLVITRDIPLAARLVEKNIRVINDRGTVYTEINISERLSVRNFMMEMYSNGIMPEKTSRMGKKEVHDFANSLDRELQQLIRRLG
jgi:uncharacterized protein YaiI (UPF0178 family)